MAEFELYGRNGFGDRKDAGQLVITADRPLVEFDSRSNEISTFKIENPVAAQAAARYQIYNPNLVRNGRTGITSEWHDASGKFYNDANEWWYSAYKPDSGSWNDNTDNVYRFKWYPDDKEVRSKCCTGEIGNADVCGTYQRGSTKCASYMDHLCNTQYGDSKFHDRCRTWCQANPSKCQAVGLSSGYCANHMGEQKCQQYCSQPGNNCDDSMIEWCRRYNGDGQIPICSCIYAFDNLPSDKKAFASCFDNQCTEFGYKVKKWNQDKGCTNIDCSQIVAADLQNSMFDNNTITQHCGSRINELTAPNSGLSNSSSGVYQPPSSLNVQAIQEDGLSNLQIMLIVLVFIFLIVMVYMMASGSDQYTQQYQQQAYTQPQYVQPQYTRQQAYSRPQQQQYIQQQAYSQYY